MSREALTLTRFIMREERRHPEASGTFPLCSTIFPWPARSSTERCPGAGLVDILGLTGQENVQGEEVQKLDIFANDTLVGMFEDSGLLCAIASEEEEGILAMPIDEPRGDYTLAFDPLDGSSNIDANVNIGTIFSIHRRQTPDDAIADTSDFLQPGHRQVCAGYVLYGTSTMLVYTTGDGVHGFTLDPSIGEFVLSHHNIQMPAKGKIYSANEGQHPSLVRRHAGLRRPPEDGALQGALYRLPGG